MVDEYITHLRAVTHRAIENNRPYTFTVAEQFKEILRQARVETIDAAGKGQYFTTFTVKLPDGDPSTRATETEELLGKTYPWVSVDYWEDEGDPIHDEVTRGYADVTLMWYIGAEDEIWE